MLSTISSYLGNERCEIHRIVFDYTANFGQSGWARAETEDCSSLKSSTGGQKTCTVLVVIQEGFCPLM